MLATGHAECKTNRYSMCPYSGHPPATNYAAAAIVLIENQMTHEKICGVVLPRAIETM
jgi:hypothetical protein